MNPGDILPFRNGFGSQLGQVFPFHVVKVNPDGSADGWILGDPGVADIYAQPYYARGMSVGAGAGQIVGQQAQAQPQAPAGPAQAGAPPVRLSELPGGNTPYIPATGDVLEVGGLPYPPEVPGSWPQAPAQPQAPDPRDAIIASLQAQLAAMQQQPPAPQAPQAPPTPAPAPAVASFAQAAGAPGFTPMNAGAPAPAAMPQAASSYHNG